MFKYYKKWVFYNKNQVIKYEEYLKLNIKYVYEDDQ